jgi:hypothetical protein
MAETWDETKPAGSRNPKLGDDDIREFKRAMRERLAEDHDFNASESPAYGAGGSTIGHHKALRLIQQGADPATLSTEGALYTKSTSGNSELWMRATSSGTPAQFTRGGMQKRNSLIPFNDGNYDFNFPTNQMAAGIIMLGNSSTITWFYMNYAPPGWKILPVGDDYLIGAGTNIYATGGVGAGQWTITGLTHSHYHDMGSHTHGAGSFVTNTYHYHDLGSQASGTHFASATSGEGIITYVTDYQGSSSQGISGTSGSTSLGNSGGASSNSVSSNGSWKPQALCGKLCQLNAA